MRTLRMRPFRWYGLHSDLAIHGCHYSHSQMGNCDTAIRMAGWGRMTLRRAQDGGMVRMTLRQAQDGVRRGVPGIDGGPTAAKPLFEQPDFAPVAVFKRLLQSAEFACEVSGDHQHAQYQAPRHDQARSANCNTYAADGYTPGAARAALSNTGNRPPGRVSTVSDNTRCRRAAPSGTTPNTETYADMPAAANGAAASSAPVRSSA